MQTLSRMSDDIVINNYIADCGEQIKSETKSDCVFSILYYPGTNKAYSDKLSHMPVDIDIENYMTECREQMESETM